MNHRKQIESFERGLDKLIDNYAREMNLTYAEVIGVLMIQVAKLTKKMEKENEE